ncbi:sugar transferase [Longimicrobium sp.]|uniref:sugar transferase n=1 Tax=Longimicrobium sp. TaxID=2029185 RepID=UPI002C3442A9|nr:sugar transferase [Longimicrobium sp.]HSU17087.1 sugar transferase [Longimicrobium sp.]
MGAPPARPDEGAPVAPPPRGAWPAAKRAIDVAGSAVLLAGLSPLLAVLAVAVRVEGGGPVFYRQERLGQGGRTFRMFKFRTMRPGSDRAMELNPDGSVRTSDQDPRITRVGRVLRRLSLDELPQLLNVLLGHMSLVGPRPDLPFHAQYYGPRERAKLAVRPGITGLAQVSGRNALPWPERLQLDAEYVERFSPGMDLRIVGRTLRNVVRQEGIYAHTSTPGDGRK